MRKRKEIVAVSEEFRVQSRVTVSSYEDDEDDESEFDIDTDELDSRNAEVDDGQYYDATRRNRRV